MESAASLRSFGYMSCWVAAKRSDAPLGVCLVILLRFILQRIQANVQKKAFQDVEHMFLFDDPTKHEHLFLALEAATIFETVQAKHIGKFVLVLQPGICSYLRSS